MGTMKTLIRLYGSTSLYQFSSGAHVRRYVFSRCGSKIDILEHVMSVFRWLDGPTHQRNVDRTFYVLVPNLTDTVDYSYIKQIAMRTPVA